MSLVEKCKETRNIQEIPNIKEICLVEKCKETRNIQEIPSYRPNCSLATKCMQAQCHGLYELQYIMTVVFVVNSNVS